MKRLGTSGFKFPAKGSLPVILSSMGGSVEERVVFLPNPPIGVLKLPYCSS